MIERELGIKLSRSAVGRAMAALGFTPQRPLTRSTSRRRQCGRWSDCAHCPRRLPVSSVIRTAAISSTPRPRPDIT
ncbi:MAG: hypothetical protein GVY09_09995 [Gammaproteobacteria bacterium]|nr:hypothetical protein [Gammaproteobacteria bacterium]